MELLSVLEYHVNWKQQEWEVKMILSGLSFCMVCGKRLKPDILISGSDGPKYPLTGDVKTFLHTEGDTRKLEVSAVAHPSFSRFMELDE